MKKGMQDMMFVWIFTIIAGAVILMFFFRFAMGETGVMEAKNARLIALSFDDKMTAFGVSEESNKIIPMNFDASFSFGCKTIETGGFEMETDKIIFAPSFLDGRDLAAVVKEWSFPYPITKFFYLSNKQSRILIVYDINSYEYVQGLLVPESFNVQKQSASLFDPARVQQESSTLDSVTIVFFTPTVPNKDRIFSTIKVQNLHVVHVLTNTNEIRIYTRQETQNDFYLGEEMLLGGMAAPENYACLKERAMEKLRIMTRVYEESAGLLKAKADDAECAGKLHETQNTLSLYRQTTINQVLHDYAETIEQQNENLEKHDCASIY